MDAETSDLIDKAEELEETGLYAEAAIIWREVVSREPAPSYEEAYYNLGLTFRNDDMAKALRLFEKALKLDPQYAPAHREFTNP